MANTPAPAPTPVPLVTHPTVEEVWAPAIATQVPLVADLAASREHSQATFAAEQPLYGKQP